MRKPAVRYPVDPTRTGHPGLTPGQLKKASKAQQIETMRLWFFERFEDPVHRSPYISAEGGYQYIWGGPYDAHDQLGNEFGGVVPDRVIQALADELFAESPNWTSAPRDDDYDETGSALFADDGFADRDFALDEPDPGQTEAQKKAAVVQALDEVQAVLDELEPATFGIGHNQPPEAISEAPEPRLSADEIRHGKEDVAAVREEVGKEAADVSRVKAALDRLRGLAWKALQFTVKVGAEKAVEFGGMGAAAVLWPRLHDTIGKLDQVVSAWLPHISPF